MKKAIAILLLCTVMLMASSCVMNSTGGNQSNTTSGASKEEAKEPGFNTVVKFDDFEITLSDSIKFVKIDNSFSDKDGTDVVEVPATIKNVGDKTAGLNIFYYKFFGPKGTQLDNVSTYFGNDHFGAGEIRPGGVQETYFHFPYEGDGDYYMQLSALIGKDIEIRLPITKANAGTDEQMSTSKTDDQTSTTSSAVSSEESEEPGFNTAVQFDGFEITLSDSIKFVKIDNEFSDKNGADVVEVPATIKNIGDETAALNVFYYKFFGPKGTQLDNVSAYFHNDHLSAGEIRPGSEQETYFHFPYEGDGDYYMKLSTFVDEDIEIRLPIAKAN